MYLVQVIRTDSNGEEFSEIIEVQDQVDNVEEALRAAVKEYLQTEDGQDDISRTGYFDWGSAFTYVPDEIWEKHGLNVQRSEVITETVDLNENEDLTELIKE
jgi:hypothetical protein